MRRLGSYGVTLLVGGALLVMEGCLPAPESVPTRFYLLTAMPGAEAAVSAGAPRSGPALGVGPLAMPAYLNRPNVVTRAGRNRLHLAEFDRWGEPLKENVSRVLAENLSFLLATSSVYVFPWRGSPRIDYQITVEITRFDAGPGGNVILIARWGVVKEDRGRVIQAKTSTVTQFPDGPDVEALSAAMSRALGELSREMAEVIRSDLN